MADRDVFAAYVHDVKNDLAWLVGRAEEHNDREMRRVALEAAERLTLLLTFLRRERGELRAHVDGHCPADLLEELAAGQRALYPQTVEVDCSGAPDLWFFDLGLMRLALRNLLVNAARHAAGRIGIRLEEVQDHLLFIVADDGPGFPEEILAGGEISSTDTTGTGLGLSLARHIAELHSNGGRRGFLHLANRSGAVATLGLPR